MYPSNGSVGSSLASPHTCATHSLPQAFYIQPAGDAKGKDGKSKAPPPPESGNERKVVPPRQDSLTRLKKAADRAGRKTAKVFGGENKPFASMMVLTSIYMVTELAMSLITGCVRARVHAHVSFFFSPLRLLIIHPPTPPVSPNLSSSSSTPTQPTHTYRSIALEADAFHMLSDVLALGTAWWAQVRTPLPLLLSFFLRASRFQI